MTTVSDLEEARTNHKSIFKRIFNYFVKPNKLEDTVKEIIEEGHPERKKMSKGEQEILHNFLQFGDKNVGTIMVPRSEISAIKMDSSLDEIAQIVSSRSHTRLPVYKDDIDHIHGFINIKDIIPVLAGKVKFSIEKILRKTLTIVPNMRVIDVLTEMQNKQTHIAIVIDEYGATDGMVTIEDIIEELVGEIEDEHDIKNATQEYVKVEDSVLICSGRIEISKVEKALDIQIPLPKTKNIETIAGLILNKNGSIPKIGDVIEISKHLKAEILEATPRYIKKVKISSLK